MNNFNYKYQFKKFVYLFGNLIVYATITCYPALAVDPHQPEAESANIDINKRYRQEATDKYFSAVVSQFVKPNNLSTALTAKLKDNHMFDSKQTPAQDVNGFFKFLRSLVYDSDNPGPFFDSLIATQSKVLPLQEQAITWGEKFLGPRNSMVVQIKESRQNTLKYIEALKQQKLLLEQSAQVKHHN